jgi:hypothetical protein
LPVKAIWDIDTPPVVLSLAIGTYCILISTFAPSSLFSINRVFLICAIFFMPFSIGAIVVLMRSGLSVPGERVVPVLLVAVILINTGAAAIVVFDEMPPQKTVARDEVINSNDSYAKYELNIQRYPPSDYHASQWIMSARNTESLIYSPKRPTKVLTYFFYTGEQTLIPGTTPPGPYRPLPDELPASGDYYVFDSWYMGQTGQFYMDVPSESDPVSTQKYGDFKQCLTIYSNGDSKIHRGPCDDTGAMGE